MLRRSGIIAIAAITTFAWASASLAQTAAPTPSNAAAGQQANPASEKWKTVRWNSGAPPESYWQTLKSGPAPKRDLSGTWDGGFLEGGVQPNGAFEYPDDPEHVGRDVPYTAMGKEARAKNKPGSGMGQVPVVDINDPVDYCDPLGMPRNDLFEFRTIEILQKKDQVVILNEENHSWRVVWTDGRELPDDPAPRWYGYATGKWEDDYTFVANYVGLDERTWLDNVGRPHSDALKVEERWQRVNADTLELTVTIDDPKFYTQPWKALNKFVLHRLPDGFDIQERICSATEVADYNRLIGKPTAPPSTESTGK